MSYSSISPSSTLNTSRNVTPATPCSSSDVHLDASTLCTPIGEPLLSDYGVLELPSDSQDSQSLSSETPLLADVTCNGTVNAALVAKIEALEEQKKSLTAQVASKKNTPFRIEEISHDDSLVHFYTGFHTFMLLFAFYKFLGPSVNCLQYWETRSIQCSKTTHNVATLLKRVVF